MTEEYEENGIKIQRLPTYGQPLSVKTRKQGRTPAVVHVNVRIKRKKTKYKGAKNV